MRRLIVPVLMLAACGGPNEETLVDELRVISTIPAAPEARPGETVDVRITAVNPTAAAVDLLVWSCTVIGPPGTPCLESESGNVNGWTAVVRDAGLHSDVSLTVSPRLAPLAAAGQPITSSITVLACEAGTCGLIDAVGAGPLAIQPGWDAVEAGLSDLSETLRGVPLTGVAASTRPWLVSGRSDEERNQNPVISGTFEGADVLAGESATLSLTVQDGQGVLDAYGYATQGGFEQVVTPIEVDRVTLTWFAPEEGGRGDVDLFVVASDGLGGEALWQGQVRIAE